MEHGPKAHPLTLVKIVIILVKRVLQGQVTTVHPVKTFLPTISTMMESVTKIVLILITKIIQPLLDNVPSAIIDVLNAMVLYIQNVMIVSQDLFFKETHVY